MLEYIPCYGGPAEHWGPLPATRPASRKIIIEQNIKKRTGPALCVFCGLYRTITDRCLYSPSVTNRQGVTDDIEAFENCGCDVQASRYKPRSRSRIKCNIHQVSGINNVSCIQYLYNISTILIRHKLTTVIPWLTGIIQWKHLLVFVKRTGVSVWRPP